MPKKILFSLLIFLIIVCFTLVFTERIPPHANTLTRMVQIARAIDHYFQKNKKIPQDITELNNYGITTNMYFDAWGNKFVYDFIEPNIVILKSLGKDKRLGGEAKDKDITVKYYSEDRLIKIDGKPIYIDVNN